MEHITKKEEKIRMEADKRIQQIREKYLPKVETFNKPLPTTVGEARQYAIDYQNWVSEQNLSLNEVIEWANVFKAIGKKFDLLDEFKENWII